MEIQALFIVAIALGMDCFSVSLGVGGSQAEKNNRSMFRLSFHFGLFQGLMALLGWLMGTTVVSQISQFDHWIAFGLLVWVGIRMVINGIKPDSEKSAADPTRGKFMVLLSVATSIDALAVGLSLGLLDVNILNASLLIGLISFAMSIVGVMLGHRLSEKFGNRMEIIGGFILILIGFRILISHLFPGYLF
jgi:manganese efflux pump family protein